MEKLTVEKVNSIDSIVMQAQPRTKQELSEILDTQGVKYEILPVHYFGYPVGVRVKLKGNSRSYIRPKNNLVYAILK